MKYIKEFSNYSNSTRYSSTQSTSFFAVTTILNFIKLTSIALMLIRWVMTVEFDKKIKSPVYDESMTKTLRNITGDNSFYIYEMDMNSPNAFVTVKRKSLFYTKKLKEILTKKELIAVMLHEYNHSNNNHVIKNFAITGSSWYMSSLVDKAILDKLTSENIQGSNGVYMAIAVFYTRALILNLPIYIVGRNFELKSDEYSAKMGYGPELISSLNKLYAYSPPNVDSKWSPIKKYADKIINFLNTMTLGNLDVHPDLDTRIKNITATKEYKEAQEKALKDLPKVKI